MRYASVYRSFKDISSFLAELKDMMKEREEPRKHGKKSGEEKPENA